MEEAEAFSHDEGEVDVRRGFEQGAAVATEKSFLGGGEVEDAEGLAGIVRRNGAEGGEGGVDRKAGLEDFFLRDAPAAQGFEGGAVCDEEVVGGGAEPGGVDLDGIGDDGEDGELVTGFLEAAFEKIRVDGVG